MNSKIKILIPLAVLILTVVSFYSMLDTNMKTVKEYRNILDTARNYASQGIVDDAVKYYEKALEYKSDVNTYIEYVNVYVDNGYEKKALRVAEEMVDEISDSKEAYECLLDRYISLEDYESCFSLDDEAGKKHVKSDGFEKKMMEIEYSYSYDYQIYDDVNAFSGGYASVKSGEYYGIIDEKGNRVLNNAYKDAGYFSYYTNAKSTDDSGYVLPVCTKDGRWMYISPSGSKKIELSGDLKFDKLGLYVDKGLTAASIDGKFAYYNTNFEKQFGEYLFAGTFNCYRAAVQTGENEWYIINEKGEMLNSIPYLEVVLDEKGIAFRNDRAFVLIDSNYYMIDTDCNVIGEQKYMNAKPFLDSLNSSDVNNNAVLAAVCIDGKWGFINVDGKTVIEPQFMDAHSFSKSFAAVSQDGKWGFILPDGSIAIDYIFEDVKDFNGKGCVFTYENSRWTLIKLYRDNH